MDIALILGLLIAFGSLVGMITIEGAHVGALLLPAPMVLVFGATIAVGLASSTLKDFFSAWKSLGGAFRGKTPKFQVVIKEIVTIAEKARKDGLLALEQEANSTEDPFIRNALQNIADGTDGEDLEELLDDEIDAATSARRSNAKFFKTLGGYAPTIGIIGTVVSLTHVLENLSEPDHLGPMIATAFVATLWGLLSANFIWLPLGDRLGRLAELEQQRLTIIKEGLLAVQEGSQPRVIEERLNAMLTAGQRPKQKKEPKPGRQQTDGAAE